MLLGDPLSEDLFLYGVDTATQNVAAAPTQSQPLAYNFEVCDSLPSLALLTKLAVGENVLLSDEFSTARALEFFQQDTDTLKAIAAAKGSVPQGQQSSVEFGVNCAKLVGDAELELAVACGYGKNGSVALLQRSLKPLVVTSFELSGCTDAWTLYDPRQMGIRVQVPPEVIEVLDDQKSDADDVIVIGDDEDADADEKDGDKPRAAKPKRARLRQSVARAASQGAPGAAASVPLEESAPLPDLADQTHRLLVLSRVDSSLVLEAGADFTELDESGFCTGDATIAVGHMHCNALGGGQTTTFSPIIVPGSTREAKHSLFYTVQVCAKMGIFVIDGSTHHIVYSYSCIYSFVLFNTDCTCNLQTTFIRSASVCYFVARRVQQARLSGSREIVSASLSDRCGLLLSQDGLLFLLQLQSPQPLTAAAAYSEQPQISISLKELTTFEVRHMVVLYIVPSTVLYIKS